MKLIAVLTTTGSEEEARAIAASLVERRLAACVQVSPIESVYRWDGAIQHDREFRVFAKTTSERYPDLETAIRELHSYDLPAIYAIDLDQVSPPYAEWVCESVRDGDG